MTQAQDGGSALRKPLFTDEGPQYADAAYKHNRPFATEGPYQTRLAPALEKQFRRWLKANNVEYRPDDPKSDYDMRGWWKEHGANQAVAGDFYNDKWKTPYDTTFSNQSVYATPDNPFTWKDPATLIDQRDGSPVFFNPSHYASDPGEPMETDPIAPPDQPGKAAGGPTHYDVGGDVTNPINPYYRPKPSIPTQDTVDNPPRPQWHLNPHDKTPDDQQDPMQVNPPSRGAPGEIGDAGGRGTGDTLQTPWGQQGWMPHESWYGKTATAAAGGPIHYDQGGGVLDQNVGDPDYWPPGAPGDMVRATPHRDEMPQGTATGSSPYFGWDSGGVWVGDKTKPTGYRGKHYAPGGGTDPNDPIRPLPGRTTHIQIGDLTGGQVPVDDWRAASPGLKKLAIDAWITKACQAEGVDPAVWGPYYRTLIGRETGQGGEGIGDPNIINLWDSNATAGHPSIGIGQVIQPNAPGQNLLDPVVNLRASIRHIKEAYGDIRNVQQADASKPPKGYDQGGGVLDRDVDPGGVPASDYWPPGAPGDMVRATPHRDPMPGAYATGPTQYFPEPDLPGTDILPDRSITQQTGYGSGYGERWHLHYSHQGAVYPLPLQKTSGGNGSTNWEAAQKVPQGATVHLVKTGINQCSQC